MSLTQPFISNIPAFDAKSGETIYINVFGGDKVDTVTLDFIVLDDTFWQFSKRINVTDGGGDGIRTFAFPLANDFLDNFLNGKSYQVRAYTSSVSGEITVNSISSTMKFFTCYKKPEFALSWFDRTSSTWKPLTSSTVWKSDSVQCRVSVTSKTAYSGYNFSEMTAVLYRYNTIWEKVADFPVDVENDYTFTINEFEVGKNSNIMYVVVLNSETVDGMKSIYTVMGVNCSYTDMGNISSFTAQNWCSVGKMRLTLQLDASTLKSVQTVIIRRKESSKSEWAIAGTIDDVAKGNQTNIELFDHFCGSRKNYDYKATAYDAYGQTLSEKQTSVYSEFESVYIGDSDNVFEIDSLWSVTDAQRVQSSALYETYSRKYPSVSYNASLNYAKQTTSATLLSAKTLKGYVDGYSQTEVIETFNDFLTNRKPKFMKDFNGNIRIITVIDSVSNGFDSNIGNAIASTTFSWVEISDFTNDSLSMVGLKNGFIAYKKTYSIRYNLVNCTSSNNDAEVSKTGTYSTTLTANDGYSLLSTNVKITMGGFDYSGYYNPSTGRITFAVVTGDIVIEAVATAAAYKITNNLSSVYNVNRTSATYYGNFYSGSLFPEVGYEISSVSVTMGGVNITSTAYSRRENRIFIPFVTGNITITASATTIYPYRLYIYAENCSVTATTTRNGRTVVLYSGSGIDVGEIISWNAVANPTYTMVEPSSGVITVDGNETITATATSNKLSPPQNVALSGVDLSWEKVENATNYDISIGGTFIGDAV